VLRDVQEISGQPRVVADDTVQPRLPVGVGVFRGQAVRHAQQGCPVHAAVVEIADETTAYGSVVEITALPQAVQIAEVLQAGVLESMLEDGPETVGRGVFPGLAEADEWGTLEHSLVSLLRCGFRDR